MNRTRKWAFVRQEAERLARLGLTSREIGRRVEVSVSQVDRWFKAGKLVRAKVVLTPIPAVRQSPEEWGQTIRQTHGLDATDSQLVTLAEQALALAQNAAEPSRVRIAAMARYQSLTKQLRLVAKLADQTSPPPPPRPRHPRRTVDPRNVLRAV